MRTFEGGSMFIFMSENYDLKIVFFNLQIFMLSKIR